jgi:hypothetical protein
VYLDSCFHKFWAAGLGGQTCMVTIHSSEF